MDIKKHIKLSLALENLIMHCGIREIIVDKEKTFIAFFNNKEFKMISIKEDADGFYVNRSELPEEVE
ncbi:hypothetical protein phiOC_p324 [Ochrobactrum phage vB_OspM_OC]|nr:hypothetical protein phiOC_p324 [Ochrobactrum phage vB_OspM_OC]